MDKIFKKIKFLIFITIITLILFFYFWVFSPLKTELEITLNKNFESTVSITEMNVENKFSRFIEGAESLSSRSMIRNKIESYKLEEVSFLELQNYTADKYSDGVKVLDNIVAAFRVTDEQIIARWGNQELEDYKEYIDYNNQETGIKIIKSECLILINSLIIKDGTKLGHDLVIYNLESLMDAIDKENLNCEIIFDMHTPESYETEENIVEYRQLLDTNYWLVLEQSKDDLYFQLNNLSYRIIVGFIILLSVIIVFFYKISKETSKKVIEQLEEQVKQ